MRARLVISRSLESRDIFSLQIWCFVTLADLPSSPVGVGLTQANFWVFLLTDTFAFTLSPIRLASFQEWALTATGLATMSQQGVQYC